MSEDEKSLLNVFHNEKINIDSAQLSPEISFVGDDEKTGHFSVTLDRVSFENISDIVLKVLRAKGFALNIENVLASIDQCRFGIRGKGEAGEPMQAESFNFCLEVPTPSKRTKGTLLQKFYEEVKAYEVHIQKLKEKHETLEKQKKTQSVTNLREEVKELKFENSQLKENLKRVNERLDRALSQVGSQQETPENVDLDLGAFRVARVTNVRLKENKVHLKSEQSAFTFDLSSMIEVPMVGARCLAYFEEGAVKKLYPFDEKTKPFNLVLGEVLSMTKEGLKVRDRDRNLLVIPHLNLEWEKRARELIRGTPVLLYKHEGQVVFWRKLKEKKWFREDIVHEDIFQSQMSKIQRS